MGAAGARLRGGRARVQQQHGDTRVLPAHDAGAGVSAAIVCTAPVDGHPLLAGSSSGQPEGNPREAEVSPREKP